MTVYLRTADGKRLLLDTAKCKLVFEETEYDLTGATLDFYSCAWKIIDGEWTIGHGGAAETNPAKILQIRDVGFTGLGVDVPFLYDSAKDLAGKLTKRARRRLRI